MTTGFQSPATPYFKRFSRVLVVAVFFITILVLIGWIGKIEFLKRLMTGTVAVNPLTAICFLMCAISLWLRKYENTEGKNLTWSLNLAKTVAVIGLAKFLSFLFSFEIYIDTLLFHDQLYDPVRIEMNRMAPNTSFCFFLSGLSLMWLDRNWLGGRRPAQYFSIIITFIALLSLYGYIYGVKFLYGIAHYIPMSVITAINFLLLSLAILFARPDKGTMAVIIGDTSAEVTLLRLAAFIIPLLMGWLKLKGEKLGYFSTEFGTALFAIATYALAMFLLGRRSVVNYRMRLVKSQAAEEVKKAHHRFLQFFQLSPEIKAISDLNDGSLLYVNRAFETFFGVKAEDAVGKKALDIITISNELRSEILVKIKNSEIILGVETRFRNAAGELRDIYIDTAIIELEDQKCLLSNMLDITARKKAEVALQQKEQLLRSIVDNIGEGLAVMSPEGDYLVLNQKAQQIINQAPSHIPVGEISAQFGLFYHDMVTPVPHDETSIARSFRGLETNELELFIRNPSIPEGKFIVSTGRPIRDSEGKIIAAVTVFRDDTNRKQLVSLLNESEQKLKDVIATVGEGVIICNPDGKFMLFNNKAEEILGQGALDISPEEWPSKYYLYHPGTDHIFKWEELPIMRALKGEMMEQVEVSVRNPASGTEKNILVSARPVRGGNNEIVAAITDFRDVTEVKHLEHLLNDVKEKYNQLVKKNGKNNT